MNDEPLLTKAEALALVSERLRERSRHELFVVVDEYTLVKPFGWVFFYNSDKFVKTGEFKYQLAGNGPVMVNSRTREIEFCGTNRSFEELMAEYDRKWG